MGDLPGAAADSAVGRRRARRREEILAAARRVAAVHGVGGFSLRDLATEVGVRPPSLYEYFADKAAIHDALFAQGWAEFVAAARTVPPTGDREQDLAADAEVFLDFCAEDLPRYQLLFTRVVPGWEPSPAAFQASVDALGLTVGRLAALGITRADDVDLVLATFSGLAAQQAANDPDGVRYRRLVRPAARMLLAHLDDQE